MGSVDDGIVDDLEVGGFALVVGAGEAGVGTVDEDIVADEGVALDLHDVVVAVVAEIAFDGVNGFAVGAVDGDAGVVRVVDVIFGDEIAP